MIGTITPLVQGAHGTSRWTKALLAYAAGSVTASAIVGGLAGLVGLMIGGPWSWTRPALIGAALGVGLIEFGLLPRPRRLRHRSTRKAWRARFGPVGSAILWGGDLGLGVSTRVTFASFWIVIAGALLLAGPAEGAALMGAYGIGRTALVATGPLLMRGRFDEYPMDAIILDSASWHRFHAWTAFAIAVLLASASLVD